MLSSIQNVFIIKVYDYQVAIDKSGHLFPIGTFYVNQLNDG
jgi:hypothetical protein